MMMIMMMIILMRIMATLGKGSFLNVQTLNAKKNNNLLDNLPVTSPLPSASSWPHFYHLFDNFF